MRNAANWPGIFGLILAVCVAGQADAHGETKHVLDTSKEGMKAIAQSLGVKCTHCHTARTAEGKPDFEAPSPRKKTAIHMKVHFVDGLKTAKGEELNCVACHNGEARFLPRDVSMAKPSMLQASGMDRREIVQTMRTVAETLDVKCDFCHVRSEDGRLDPVPPTKHKLMAKYMMDHYAGKLVGKDGKPVTCGTCHQGKTEFLPR